MLQLSMKTPCYYYVCLPVFGLRISGMMIKLRRNITTHPRISMLLKKIEYSTCIGSIYV